MNESDTNSDICETYSKEAPCESLNLAINTINEYYDNVGFVEVGPAVVGLEVAGALVVGCASVLPFESVCPAIVGEAVAGVPLD